MGIPSTPSERESFVGRARELGELERAARDGARLITLIGPAGAGKTRIARRFAGRFAEIAGLPGEGAASASWFVEATEAHRLPELVGAVAAAMGVPLAGDDAGASLVRMGHALAGAGCALLVLDNLEQVIVDAATVASAWLDRVPGLRILATSRERLAISGEHVVEIGALDEEDAATLFVQRAKAARADFAPDAPAVLDIVRRVDGLPLALELAAARASVLDLDALAARLGEGIDLLSCSRRDVSGRQSTLERALAWSWDLLGASERQALAQASVFRGTFTAEDAEAVLDVGDDVLACLERLRAKSLLFAREARPLRLGMYNIVRAFARARDVDAARTAQRHAEHYAALAEEVAGGARGDEELPALDRLEAERQNLAAAHAWAIGRDSNLAARLALATEPLLLHRGPARELEAMLSAALAGDLSPLMRARVHRARGAARRALGDLRAACMDLEASRDASTELPYERAQVLAPLGDVQRSLGRHDEAAQTLEDALAAAEAVGDRELIGAAKRATGSFYLDRNRLHDAVAPLTEACAAFRAAGSALREGPTLDLLGDLYSLLGDPAQAIALHEEALATHRRVQNRRAEAITLDHLAGLLTDGGRLDEALALSSRALAMFRALGSRSEEGHAHYTFGMALGDCGRTAEAASNMRRALFIAREVGAKRLEAAVVGWLGVLSWESGEVQEAAELLAEAVQKNRDMKIVREEMLFGAFATGIAAMRGRVVEARADLEVLRARATVNGDRTLEGLTDLLEAVVLLREGREADARARVRWAKDTLAQAGEVRPALRVIERLLEAPHVTTVLEVARDARWFLPPHGSRVDLTRRRPLRLILARLVDARERDPGASVSLEDIVASGWPGERVLVEAAATRAYTAVRRLRDLGLREILVTTGDGYALSPDVALVLA